MSARIIPESRLVSLSLTVRKNGFGPDVVKLKRELSKKYPVESVQLRTKNPLEPDGNIRLFIVVYLLKDIFGPTLKQMVKDAYRYAKKQMAEKQAKKLATPPGFIHNGALPKKRPRRKG